MLDENKNKKESKINKIINSIKVSSCVILGFGLSCKLFSDWTFLYFGQVTPWQIIYTINNTTKGTDKAIIKTAITGPVLKTVLCIMLLLAMFVLTNFINKLFIKICQKNTTKKIF